jgi:hypothetical protein
MFRAQTKHKSKNITDKIYLNIHYFVFIQFVPDSALWDLSQGHLCRRWDRMKLSSPHDTSPNCSNRDWRKKNGKRKEKRKIKKDTKKWMKTKWKEGKKQNWQCLLLLTAEYIRLSGWMTKKATSWHAWADTGIVPTPSWRGARRR